MAEIIVHPDPELADIIPGYLENRRGDVDKLKQLLAAGDFEGLQALGHRMKGSGGGYGFEGITEIGHKIEMAAKDKNSEATAVGIHELEEYLKNVKVVYR